MLRRMILTFAVLLSTAGLASANGYGGFYGSYYNNQIRYATPGYGGGYVGGYRGGFAGGYTAGYGAPVVYYRVPIYVIPRKTVRTVVKTPVCGCQTAAPAIPSQAAETTVRPAETTAQPQTFSAE